MRAERRGSRVRSIGRIALVAALALGSSGCKLLDDGMVLVFGRSMRSSVAFDPYENPRMPAAGSVPFASGNYPAAAGQVGLGQHEPIEYDVPPFDAADMARGVDAVASGLVNPVPADSASLARGELMFNRYCAVCHGPQGDPAQAPILEKLPLMSAFNLATGPAATTYNDGYLYGMIRVGRGSMPSYGHQVSHFDRWNIVNYVRQLQAAAAPPAGAAGGGG